jgi:hypothetical protein
MWQGLFVSAEKSGSSYINTGQDGVRILITYFAIAAIADLQDLNQWKTRLNYRNFILMIQLKAQVLATS